MNVALYRFMISDFLLPELEARNPGDISFQQDNGTSHTAAQTMDLLRGPSDEQIISHFEPVSWPPKSCDITHFDFFLWLP